VIRVLDQVVTWHGQPQAIRLENGPELIAERFRTCTEWAIELRYIQPRKPDQNAFIERFNRTSRTEVLNTYVFESLHQVQEISVEWLRSYNEEWPHEALAGLPPVMYRAHLKPEVLLCHCLLDREAYRTFLLWEKRTFLKWVTNSFGELSLFSVSVILILLMIPQSSLKDAVIESIAVVLKNGGKVVPPMDGNTRIDSLEMESMDWAEFVIRMDEVTTLDPFSSATTQTGELTTVQDLAALYEAAARTTEESR
jgi:putative transposase